MSNAVTTITMRYSSCRHKEDGTNEKEKHINSHIKFIGKVYSTSIKWGYLYTFLESSDW